ncbi:MAG TPA: pilin [Patescibacteria group bacterium]|jgi:hypothetical protein|nr:pilin [Patescibacteria group bacterium]
MTKLNFKLASLIFAGFIAVNGVLIFSNTSSVLAQSAGVSGNVGAANRNSNTAATNTVQPTDKPTNGDKGGFVPCGNTAGNPCQIGHLFSAFVVIVNYLIAMAGFVAVLAIVYAGFMMIYSQGQEQLKTAKGRFSGAVIGLVLVALAFVLVNALFTGSLSIGVKDGASILASPLDYINKQ